MRLIYNGTIQSGNICHGNGHNVDSLAFTSAYSSNCNNSSYVGWTYSVGNQRPSTVNPQESGTESPIKTALESWYESNITDKSKVVAGKFCNDRNVGSGSYSVDGSTFYYAAYSRLNGETTKPTLACPNGDVYKLSVGMITADEIYYAGASSLSNRSYFLYSGRYYWTMSPYYWDGNSSGGGWSNMAVVDGNSGGLVGHPSSIDNSARPVINLRSDVKFKSGSDGTQNNPYIVQ